MVQTKYSHVHLIQFEGIDSRDYKQTKISFFQTVQTDSEEKDIAGYIWV